MAVIGSTGSENYCIGKSIAPINVTMKPVIPSDAVRIVHVLSVSSVVNTAILGAFVRATGIVALEDLLTAIGHEVPVKADENRAAALEAHEKTVLGVAV